MNTGRVETFADGVFAIAATLLILNVDAASRLRPCPSIHPKHSASSTASS